ncbi:hypothetical protein [Mesorhizobium erdmanii]|uniref:hypothetical protein n=1 Tax=Mesorhizobium erdmanii TaxID=1777866 RepID=UPI0012DB1482|nr:MULTISPECIES: hypothetical protein [Mesorhizobium]
MIHKAFRPTTSREFTGKYLSCEQIEAVLQAHLAQYPDAIDRMHLIMKHPHRDNKEATNRTILEISKTLESMSFYQEYLKSAPSRSFHEAFRDVADFVGNMLGPVGSRRVEE